MTFTGVKSARSFRQFRVAVFGVTTFLRLAWAFILALNAFSLTTQTDSMHQIVAIFMFAINAAAFVFVALVGTFEAFRFKLSSWTSQVRFELTWVSIFWVLETAGATTFTIMSPSFQCDSISRVDGDATGVIFSVTGQLSPQRPTSGTEAATCQLFNRLAFIGSWIAVGLSLIYVVYFALLCLTASRRNPLVWHTPVNKFDWSITSEPIHPKSPDVIHPEMIQRPGNPHLSKDFNDSMLSLPPVFIDPFQARKDSFDSATWQPEAMEVIHYPLDRHSIMAQYQPRAIQEQQWQVSQHRPAESQSSALGLEGMEGPAIDHRKSKPPLSIYVPPPPVKGTVPIGATEEDYDRIGRTMSVAIASPQTYESHSEGPCGAIGRRMSMPFASPISSDESSEPLPPMPAMTYNRSQASLATNGHATVQNAQAQNSYPTVQQSVNRQSTMLREDSMTARRSMRFGPSGMYRDQAHTRQGSGGNILPLHIQDLSRPSYQSQDSYQHVRVMHNRTYSAAATFQSSHPPRPMPPASSNTWPAYPTHQQSYHNSPYGHDNTVFPLRFPPPPNHSPAQSSSTPNYSPSYYGTQGHQSHSRSSSVPSSHRDPINRPIPALLDALSPVLRNSGISQARILSSQHQSWRGSAVAHPFLDDNPFGGARSASRTSEGSSFEEIDSRDIPTIPTEDKKPRRASKLRKSLPRDF